MALRTNFLAVLTKSPLRTGGVNVMAEGRGGELLIEQSVCAAVGCYLRYLLALFTPWGPFQRGSANITKHQKLAFIGGLTLPPPCEQPTTLSVSVGRKRAKLNLNRKLAGTGFYQQNKNI